MNRVKTATDANSKTTTYAYDSAGNLTTVTDANSHTTTFTYDEQNQLTKTTNPLNEQKLYSYDINRNLSMVVTPNGAQIKIYNKPGWYSGEEDIAGTDLYLCLRRWIQSDQNYQCWFRLNLYLWSFESHDNSQTAGLSSGDDYQLFYDDNNNLLGVNFYPYLSDLYIYDSLNRVTGINDQYTGLLANYTYDALSRRIGKTIRRLLWILATVTTSPASFFP